MKYSRTSIKRPTFIWRPEAKSRKHCQLHTNKNLYSTVTSSRRLQPASCRPKNDFVLFYASIKSGRFEVGRFQSDEGKRMTMWNTVKTHFQQYLIETITKQSPKRFSLFVQYTSQCWVERHVAFGHVMFLWHHYHQ